MEPEYGFKPKGPEPTRYGDWEVKGKCVDFWTQNLIAFEILYTYYILFLPVIYDQR